MYSAGILRSRSTFFETRLRVPMTTHVVDSDNSTISLLCNILLLDAPYLSPFLQDCHFVKLPSFCKDVCAYIIFSLHD